MTGVAWRWRTALWFVAGCHYWHGIRFKWVRLESNFSSLSSFPSPRPRPRRPERRSMEASHLHSKSPRCSIPFLIIVCEIAPSVLVICSVPNLLRGVSRMLWPIASGVYVMNRIGADLAFGVDDGHGPRVVSVRPSHPSRRSIMQSAPLARKAFTTRVCTDDGHCL